MADGIKMSPAHGRAGRHPTRESLDAPAGLGNPGMFGRMFPDLPPLEPPAAALEALAAAMKEPDAADAKQDTKRDKGSGTEGITAGFTYLGQFIDHDITLDLTPLSVKEKDPRATQNFRTPSLDLDSIYGRGPDGSPQLYAREGDRKTSPKLLIGKTQPSNLGGALPEMLNDLPRSPEGHALIGDHRNDENLVVAQTHLAFLKFHNKVVDGLVAKPNPPAKEALFAEARRTTTWHYQWIVLHDFLEQIIEKDIAEKILKAGRRFKVAFMPVEFSGAAYRLGHSMVREAYSHNRIFTFKGPSAVAPATLGLLFKFTGLKGDIVGDLAATEPNTFERLPTNWVIDWRRYFDFKTPSFDGFVLNKARKIDPFLVPALHPLVGSDKSLALMNLMRGAQLGLPAGQDVAQALGVQPLTANEVSDGPDGAVAKAHGLHQRTPLWYYILKEAQMRRGGERLGPVGAAIVAEVLIGFVADDPSSYLSQPGWKPDLGKTPGTFTMTDLLRFVGDISPIDGIGSI